VVKTRIQLNPAEYSGGIIDSFKKVVAKEGYMGLSTGLAPTAVG